MCRLYEKGLLLLSSTRIYKSYTFHHDLSRNLNRIFTAKTTESEQDCLIVLFQICFLDGLKFKKVLKVFELIDIQSQPWSRMVTLKHLCCKKNWPFENQNAQYYRILPVSTYSYIPALFV